MNTSFRRKMLRKDSGWHHMGPILHPGPITRPKRWDKWFAKPGVLCWSLQPRGGILGLAALRDRIMTVGEGLYLRWIGGNIAQKNGRHEPYTQKNNRCPPWYVTFFITCNLRSAPVFGKLGEASCVCYLILIPSSCHRAWLILGTQILVDCRWDTCCN